MLGLGLGLNAMRGAAGAGGAASWAIDLDVLTQADFVTKDGFWDDVMGGGVRATYDNLQQGGHIPLPATLDRSRPFLFAALFEFYGPVAGRRAQVSLVDPTETSYRGLNVSITADFDARAESGTYAAFFLAPPADGALVWLGASSMGDGQLCVFAYPVPNAELGNPDNYLDPFTKDFVRMLPLTYGDGTGHGEALQNITELGVFTNGNATIIRSVVCRQGTLARGPAVINSTVAGDPTPLVRVPPILPADGPRDLVLIFHGQGSSEYQGSSGGAWDNGVAFGDLVSAGYLVAIMRGTDGGGFADTNTNNWGATGALETWWYPWLNKIKSHFSIRNVYLIGQSMGLMNALNLYALHPADFKAIAGISGASNLAGAYSHAGFSTIIDDAYGTSTAFELAPFDPTQRPAVYADIPIKLWHGDADATLDITEQMDTFAAAVNALSPGTVETVAVPGADHLDGACYDGPALLAFFQAHV